MTPSSMKSIPLFSSLSSSRGGAAAKHGKVTSAESLGTAEAKESQDFYLHRPANTPPQRTTTIPHISQQGKQTENITKENLKRILRSNSNLPISTKFIEEKLREAGISNSIVKNLEAFYNGTNNVFSISLPNQIFFVVGATNSEDYSIIEEYSEQYNVYSKCVNSLRGGSGRNSESETLRRTRDAILEEEKKQKLLQQQLEAAQAKRAREQVKELQNAITQSTQKQGALEKEFRRYVPVCVTPSITTGSGGTSGIFPIDEDMPTDNTWNGGKPKGVTNYYQSGSGSDSSGGYSVGGEWPKNGY